MRSRSRSYSYVLIPLFLSVVAGMTGCASTAVRSEFDLGFLASRDTDLHGRSRIRALGPFFERVRATNDVSFTAIRPFYSRENNPPARRTLNEFLWPVAMHRTLDKDTFWRFLVFYGNDFDNTDPQSRYRVAFIPFVFWGRDKNGEGYFAVFPIGGKLNEYLWRDKIVFALFPLYAYSSVNEVKTHTFLWPCFSFTRGDGIRRDRYFPFYARSVKENEWVKRFYIYPLLTYNRYSYPDASGYAWMLFPLLGRVNMTDQQSWLFLPPLFRYSRANDYVALNCPWPIVQYRSGELSKFYVWPVAGAKSQPGVDSWFLLWPLVSGSTTRRGQWVFRQFDALPLVSYSSARPRPAASPSPAPAAEQPETGAPPDAQSPAAVSAGSAGDSPEVAPCLSEDARARFFKLWPLFSYDRHENASRTQAPDIWPGKSPNSLRKNWEPFWTLYSRDRVGDAVEDELLWGFFRYRRDSESVRKCSLFPLFCFTQAAPGSDARKWSFLLGLIGYEREGLRKTFRLLYFPFRWGADRSEQERSAGSAPPDAPPPRTGLEQEVLP